MKYLWAFIIFVILIIFGILAIIGEILELAVGIALSGIGLLALIVLWIYVKVKT